MEGLQECLADGLLNANVAKLRGLKEQGVKIEGQALLNLIVWESYDETLGALHELFAMVGGDDPHVEALSEMQETANARVVRNNFIELQQSQQHLVVCVEAVSRTAAAHSAAVQAAELATTRLQRAHDNYAAAQLFSDM